VAQGNTLVDPKTGLPVDVVVDSTGKRRLCVDTTVTFDGSGLNVDLDPAEDGVYIGNAAGDILLINPDGSINTNVTVDAKGGDNIAVSAHSAPIFAEQAETITNLNYKEIFAYTSTNVNTKVINIECICDTPAVFRIKIDGVVKKMLRSSALEKNVVFKFEEHRPLNTAQKLTVEAKIDRQFQPSYDTFVSLEGYIA
jgi:hypothetical protein